MEHHVHKNSDLFLSKEVEAAQIFGMNQLSIEYFHLLPGSCLHIDQTSGKDGEGDVWLFYLILEGTAEFVFPDERVEVQDHDSIDISFFNTSGNFEVFAKTECRILYVINSSASVIDNRRKELLQQIDEEESREPYTKKHNARVGKYASMIMHVLDPSYHSSDLTYAGGYHDIGKILIDTEVLNKPGKLSGEEFEQIKKHPVYSYDLLREKLGETVARIARGHHEKLDGSGYPDGLKGDEILLESKILAVADIFDALTSQRCYRSQAYSFAEAMKIIGIDVDAGKLDRACFEALSQLIANGMLIEGEDNK